jgi:hypothetical protein
VSDSSNGDIDSQINKMIEIKKKGGNLQDYLRNRNKNKLYQMKSVADKFQQEKEKKQKNKKEERIIKLKSGLIQINKIYSKITKHIHFRFFIKLLKNSKKLREGFNKLKLFFMNKLKQKKINNFIKLLKYNENKIKIEKEQQMIKEQKLKKDREEKIENEKKKKMKEEEKKQIDEKKIKERERVNQIIIVYLILMFKYLWKKNKKKKFKKIII